MRADLLGKARKACANLFKSARARGAYVVHYGTKVKFRSEVFDTKEAALSFAASRRRMLDETLVTYRRSLTLAERVAAWARGLFK